MNRLTTWGAILDDLESLDRHDEIAFGTGPDSSADPCLVYDGRDLHEDEDVPTQALQRGWTTVLGKSQIQQVLSNLRAQGADPDRDLVLTAIKHFVDSDAFLTVPR